MSLEPRWRKLRAPFPYALLPEDEKMSSRTGVTGREEASQLRSLSVISEYPIGSSSICSGAPAAVIKAVDAEAVGGITSADLIGGFL